MKEVIRLKKRRKIRWSRVLLLIVFLIALLIGVVWLGKNIAVIVQGIQLKYSELVAEQKLHSKFQDEKFKQYANILFFGLDDGDLDQTNSGKRADAVFLISINKQTGQINILSIPATAQINIIGKKDQTDISKAYYYGGAQLAVRSIENFLEVPIHHYIALDWHSFEKLVNEMGGINLYVEKDMQYMDSTVNLSINLKQGYQHLNGLETAHYAMFCKDELGEVGRVKRQQKLIKVMLDEFIKIDTIIKLPKVIELINQHITTSLSMYDVATLAKYINSSSPEILNMEMLGGNNIVAQNKEIWAVDKEKVNGQMEKMFINKNIE